MDNLNLMLELLNLTNSFESTNQETNRIKNLICYLSEEKINNRILSQHLENLDMILYQASTKIRTFGYTKTKIAPINEDDLYNKNEYFFSLKNSIIREHYKSNIYKDSSLDIRQKTVLSAFNKSNPKRLLLSAPTSFGKTFLLKEMIFSNFESFLNIVIVLPTVALLQEVTNDLNDFFAYKELNYVIFNSIFSKIELASRNVFILTPERTIRLFALFPEIKVDFFFYDEIYKIDEDVSIANHEDEAEDHFISMDDSNLNKSKKNSSHRAFAFRIALYLLLKRTNNFYLAGPYIKLDSLKKGFNKFLETYNVSKLEFDFEPTLKYYHHFFDKTITIKSSLDEMYETVYISNVDPDNKNSKMRSLKKYLKINKDNQTLFFCATPANTSKYANSYSSEINESLGNKKLSSFIKHLERYYAFKYDNGKFKSKANWSIVNSLKKGIGIHNGKLPKYFQREIMGLFNSGELPVLFCTSTIIEGVNSSAKNIVLLSNPLGKNDASKRFTLLNINGRAGRYLKHFVGNVVYLDKKQSKIENSINIELDFKVFNDEIKLSELDLENIAEEDLGEVNKKRKQQLEKTLNKKNLPDEIFIKNRLIERKKQEKILKTIREEKNFNRLKGIESIDVEGFIESDYLEIILEIWCFVGEIKESQIYAIKSFANNYARKSYAGVLRYEFSKYDNESKDKLPQTEEERNVFVDEVYRKVFSNVKDTIEFQFPRIFSLFETLINRAFEIENYLTNKPLDFSPIIKFYEIGVKSDLGLFMTEKSIPIISIKKIEDNMEKLAGELEEQKKSFLSWYKDSSNRSLFDEYEQLHLDEFIRKHC